MGNNQRKLPAGYDPVQGGWEIKEKNEEFNVWRNPETGDEVDQYRRLLSDKREYDFERQTFDFRFNSSTLVSSVYLKEQTQRDMCSTFYKANLFLEHINHRLSEIDHIPYPDVLHMYHQAFRGFAELYDRVGYFEVEDDLICMNQHGKVKVWLNRDLSKATPQPNFAETHPSEANMIRKIINVIHSNTDHLTLPENILDTMRRNSVSTFREADNVLEQIAARHRTLMPIRLDCVLEMGVQMLNEVNRSGHLVGNKINRQTTTVTENYFSQQALAPASIVQTQRVQGIPAISTIQAPAVQIPALVPSPAQVVQYESIPRYSLPIQNRTARINTVPNTAFMLGNAKPFSSGFIPASVSNHASRMSYSPIISKPATAIAAPSTISVTKPLTANGVTTSLSSRPWMNRTAPNPKAVSAINFTTSVVGGMAKPVSRPPAISYLPIISQKPTLQMKRASGTNLPNKSTVVRGQAPSYTSISVPNTSSAAISVAQGIDTNLVNSAKSTTVKENATSPSGFKPQMPTPVTGAQQAREMNGKTYNYTTSTSENYMGSPISIAKTIDTADKPADLTQPDFYTKLGYNPSAQYYSTRSKANDILSTNMSSMYGNYNSNDYKYTSVGEVSPSPVVQPITHTSVSTSQAFSYPLSVSLAADNVKSSIPAGGYSSDYKQFDFGNYKSSLPETSVPSLLENYDYLKTYETTQTYKTQTLDQHEPYKADSRAYTTTEKDYTKLTSTSPPKVQFRYSSSHLPPPAATGGSGYSRTIYEGTAHTETISYESSQPIETLSYGSTNYGAKIETPKAERAPEYVSSGLGTGLTSFAPTTYTSTYEFSTTEIARTPTQTATTYISGGNISPPSSRVAHTLMHLSPSKASPTKASDYNTDLKYGYAENTSSYTQSNTGYQSASYESYHINSQTSNGLSGYSLSSYQPSGGTTYQPASTSSPYKSNSSPYKAPDSSSYGVHMDNDLLKDLQKLKKEGTLSPKKSSPSPKKDDFNTAMSFGNNSGYLRDSLKNQVV